MPLRAVCSSSVLYIDSEKNFMVIGLMTASKSLILFLESPGSDVMFLTSTPSPGLWKTRSVEKQFLCLEC
jgi:hypothetical protein